MARKRRKTTPTRRKRRSHVGSPTNRRRSYRRRRKSAMSGVPDFAMTILTATGGYLAATAGMKYLPEKLQSPMIKAGIKAAAAFGAMKFIKGKSGEAIAIGIGISAVSDLGKQFLPQFFAGVGDGSDPIVLIQGPDDGGGSLLNGSEDALGLGEEDSMNGASDALGEEDSMNGVEEGGIPSLSGSSDALGASEEGGVPTVL